MGSEEADPDGVDGRILALPGSPSHYIKLNVGGALYQTTISTLTKHDSMLRAMFSGRMEVCFLCLILQFFIIFFSL